MTRDTSALSPQAESNGPPKTAAPISMAPATTEPAKSTTNGLLKPPAQAESNGQPKTEAPISMAPATTEPAKSTTNGLLKPPAQAGSNGQPKTEAPISMAPATTESVRSFFDAKKNIETVPLFSESGLYKSPEPAKSTTNGLLKPPEPVKPQRHRASSPPAFDSSAQTDGAILTTGRFSPNTPTRRRASLQLARRNTRSIHSDVHLDEPVQDEDAIRWAEHIREKRASKRQRQDTDDDRVLMGTKVDQNHVNWAIAYNMLTGIRCTVSRANAKMARPLEAADFLTKHKFSFDISGSELTPSSQYDFKFKDYSTMVFRDLRLVFGLDPAEYLMSLTSKYILSEMGTPGKSGSFFYFSRDYKYIIKTLHHAEHKLLRKILPDYYQHVVNNPNTLLSQFYGLHRVKIPYGRKIHFVVMNNLFPPHRDIHRTFDLKGSTIGRDFKEEDLEKNPRATLKDLNWLRRNLHLEFGPIKKEAFITQMQKDVALLKRLHIMDYSMLVGIHDLERGNEENLRDKTLRVFQPDGEPTDEGGQQHLARTPSVMENAKRIKEMREAVKRQKPVPISQTLDKMPDEAHRSPYIFYADDGGFRATHEDDTPGEEIYYLGIIDCLTEYNLFKRVEHAWKGMGGNEPQISPIPPERYGDRFANFIIRITKSRERAEHERVHEEEDIPDRSILAVRSPGEPQTEQLTLPAIGEAAESSSNVSRSPPDTPQQGHEELEPVDPSGRSTAEDHTESRPRTPLKQTVRRHLGPRSTATDCSEYKMPQLDGADDRVYFKSTAQYHRPSEPEITLKEIMRRHPMPQPGHEELEPVDPSGRSRAEDHTESEPRMPLRQMIRTYLGPRSRTDASSIRTATDCSEYKMPQLDGADDRLYSQTFYPEIGGADKRIPSSGLGHLPQLGSADNDLYSEVGGEPSKFSGADHVAKEPYKRIPTDILGHLPPLGSADDDLYSEVGEELTTSSDNAAKVPLRPYPTEGANERIPSSGLGHLLQLGSADDSLSTWVGEELTKFSAADSAAKVPLHPYKTEGANKRIPSSGLGHLPQLDGVDDDLYSEVGEELTKFSAADYVAKIQPHPYKIEAATKRTVTEGSEHLPQLDGTDHLYLPEKARHDGYACTPVTVTSHSRQSDDIGETPPPTPPKLDGTTDRRSEEERRSWQSGGRPPPTPPKDAISYKRSGL